MHSRFGLVAMLLGTSALLLGCSKENGSDPAANAGAPATNSGVVAVLPSGVPLPARPAATAELPDPIVVMKTSLGDIMLRLNQKKAPRTVSNFVDYAITRHYDGTIFHQIESGYVVLGGMYSEKLVPKQTRYPIPSEAANGLKNKKGTIAMARNPADPNSATSQFFINVVDNPKLDRTGERPEEAGYCVFGEVIQGLDVLNKIAELRTASVKGFEKLPVQTVVVQSVNVVR